ncbi:hypothetical protein V2J09_017147 [Rumex salicifolius]
MEDNHHHHHHKKKQETVDLLEDGWFFGNFLNSKAKMVRCNSDPAPSSSKTKEEMFGAKKNSAESNSLLRTPSLPPKLGKEEKDWAEDEDNSPRMGDLIRQAMPCKLKKTPSLPPFRIKKEAVSNENVALTPKCKLTRRSSLDPSILLPPKVNSKSMKLNFSAPNTSKNLQQKRTDSRSLERSMSLKALSDKEVQGFQDLGFRFHRKDLCPSFVNNLSTLSIKEEPNEEGEADDTDRRLKKSPSLSEAWIATQKRTNSLPIPKWGETKSSSEDMKAQIKFWARAVASNVRQEC